MTKALASGGIAVPALIALVFGPGPFAAVLSIAAVLVLVDLADVLTRASARPLLPAALLPAVGLPVTVAFRPQVGWDLVPAFVAAGFMTTFLFALLFGRRRGIVQGAGTTMLSGLVVGLGAASLVLLRGLPDGFRWALAYLLLGAAADVGGPAYAWWRERRSGAARAVRADSELLGPAILSIVVAGVLLVVLRPPLTVSVTVLLVAVALAAAIGGTALVRHLVAEAQAAESPVSSRATQGVALRIFDGFLLGAPIAYVVARWAAL